MEIYGLAGDFPEPGEMTTGPVPADNVSPIPVADNYVFNKPLPVVAPIQKAAGASAFPRWVPVLAGKHALKSGKAQLLVVDDQPMYIALVEDDLFAIDAHCFINGQLMAGAELNGYTLSCPLHAGCHYDVRQGSRLAAPGSIDCFPIKINDSGNILIGFEMPFTPHLPTF